MTKKKAKKDTITEKYENQLEEFNKKLYKARNSGDLENTQYFIEQIKDLYKNWLQELRESKEKKYEKTV